MITERTNFTGSWDDVCLHCGKSQRDHRVIVGEHDGIQYEHRMPCQQQKDIMARKTIFSLRVLQAISLVVWVVVPLAIAVLGFTSYIIGVVLFLYSLFKIAVQAIKLFGNPDKWIPGHKEKKERDLKMANYFYHCEKNPEGFLRLKVENFDKEETEAERGG